MVLLLEMRKASRISWGMRGVVLEEDDEEEEEMTALDHSRLFRGGGSGNTSKSFSGQHVLL